MIRIRGEEKKQEKKKEVRYVRGGNVADRTHFNKMVMTIVFLVRSAERYARKKWRRSV